MSCCRLEGQGLHCDKVVNDVFDNGVCVEAASLLLASLHLRGDSVDISEVIHLDGWGLAIVYFDRVPFSVYIVLQMFEFDDAFQTPGRRLLVFDAVVNAVVVPPWLGGGFLEMEAPIKGYGGLDKLYHLLFLARHWHWEFGVGVFIFKLPHQAPPPNQSRPPNQAGRHLPKGCAI
jgi:hypothetical protein